MEENNKHIVPEKIKRILQEVYQRTQKAQAEVNQSQKEFENIAQTFLIAQGCEEPLSEYRISGDFGAIERIK